MIYDSLCFVRKENEDSVIFQCFPFYHSPVIHTNLSNILSSFVKHVFKSTVKIKTKFLV